MTPERRSKPEHRHGRWHGWLIGGLAVVASTFIAARAFVQVKTHVVRTIDVVGSAKRRITSDLIEWTAVITTDDKSDRMAAYRALKPHVEKALAYLRTQGVTAREMRVEAVETSKIEEEEVIGSGEDRKERKIFKGYQTKQRIFVSSREIAKIERVSREITRLMEAGVPVDSSAPDYLYTKLGELKIEMVGEAAKDARIRAERMLAAAGHTKPGPLRSVTMGVININPPNSTQTSWEGNNDTDNLDKDIITVVRCTFDVPAAD
jgi:uncharacterized protein